MLKKRKRTEMNQGEQKEKGSGTLNLKQIIQEQKLAIPSENIHFQEPMKNHVSFRIGGPAECFITIETQEQLKTVLLFADQNKIPITILGNGTNVLVSDQGIPGITLQIKLTGIKIENHEDYPIIHVASGEKIIPLAHQLANEGIAGMESLSGIPGSLGGAVRMNAGAHGEEMKDILQTISTLDRKGNSHTYTVEEAEFGYRHSLFQTKEEIITKVTLKLTYGKKEEIKQQMQTYANERKQKQPLEFPSAGSTFKRGNGFITAALIDQAGLKGKQRGGAKVSEKHAGFIINQGNATAEDVIELTKSVQQEVQKQFGKKIELEIELIGQF